MIKIYQGSEEMESENLLWTRLAVLVLAGVEFFTVAGAGLCYRFVLNTELMIQKCFCYC